VTTSDWNVDGGTERRICVVDGVQRNIAILSVERASA